MLYRELGKTGLKVSVVSFGGIKLGGLQQEAVNELIDRALDAGMNYIDTARAYGQSEERLGVALAGKRDKVILSTKGIRRELDRFTADFELSLKNLRTDYVDLFFIHDVSTEENWKKVQDNGILDFVDKQRRNGRIRHPAISTHSVEIGMKMLKTGFFEAVMVAYNPASTEAEDTLIPLAKSMNMGIVVMKPFGGGILTETGSRQLGFEISAEESLRFAVGNQDISTVIPGLDRVEYLNTAAAVGQSPIQLSTEEKQQIVEKVNIRSKNYCRGCGYCLPCPQGLKIPEMLKLFNRWEAYEGINWAEMHTVREEYARLELKAAKCAACNKCTERCPFSLPISGLMKTMTQKFGG